MRIAPGTTDPDRPVPFTLTPKAHAALADADADSPPPEPPAPAAAIGREDARPWARPAQDAGSPR